MVEIELSAGVPEGILSELKKKYEGEKQNNVKVTKANPAFPPYYAYGDPRAAHESVKFEGKEYWVYKVTKGRNMNWVFDH
jgi:hypothetical protein